MKFGIYGSRNHRTPNHVKDIMKGLDDFVIVDCTRGAGVSALNYVKKSGKEYTVLPIGDKKGMSPEVILSLYESCFDELTDLVDIVFIFEKKGNTISRRLIEMCKSKGVCYSIIR